jgi:hypothetical protein
MLGSSWVAVQWTASQEGLSSMSEWGISHFLHTPVFIGPVRQSQLKWTCGRIREDTSKSPTLPPHAYYSLPCANTSVLTWSCNAGFCKPGVTTPFSWGMHKNWGFHNEHNMVVWVVTLYSLIGKRRRFGTTCLYLNGGSVCFRYVVVHVPIYRLTPWNWLLLKKLPVAQLLKNFPTFYDTRKFTTMLIITSVGSYPELHQSNQYHPILPPTSRSSYCSLSFWLSRQNLCIRLVRPCYMPCPYHLRWLSLSNYISQ